MILKDKKILVTGVVTRHSIAFHVARKVQELGGKVIITGLPGKGFRLTEKTAGFLDPVPTVLPLDVTDAAQLTEVVEKVKEEWGSIDGILHSIAYAPPTCLGGEFSKAPWEDVSTAFHISSYSLASLTSAFEPIMKNGSVIGLDFDAGYVWVNYNWMGVCKAALESIARYLAWEMGTKNNTRVNLIAAGPLKTMAAKGIPAFANFESLWDGKSILEWNFGKGHEDVANTAAWLFSDLSAKVTGEIIHVDGGFHAMGTPVSQGESEE